MHHSRSTDWRIWEIARTAGGAYIGCVTFVGRELQLSRLDEVIEESRRGGSHIAFLAGGAGAGKSSLLQAFVSRAESAHPDLVSAIATCNAQAGLGDPYLPFLDLVTQLTGNVESRVAQGALTDKSASRLRRIASLSADLLVEYAPDLIGTLIPGSSLIVGVVKRAAEKAGMVDKLNARLSGASAEAQEVDAGRIMERYTTLIRELAARVPLLLVIDDLHWGDPSSIALLFHLVQHLGDAPVVIIGAYRPNDITFGRGGERHPLVQVLNELKRYYGDVVIDIEQTSEAERRAFVDALIDREPNELDERFRTALLGHTRGHPLFTVELLRNLQERGDVFTNDRGVWTAAEKLDWSVLPSRVEGVVQERIGRLDNDLREILRVASVEGESFTAEIIARVEELSERLLLRKLTEDLQKRHQLVSEGEVRKVGGQWLSNYAFTQALVQQYVYNDLSKREKMMLHSSIAEILEQLYGRNFDDVAAQLAHHYYLAGDNEKAFFYSMYVARRAIRQGACGEALHQLDLALGLVPSLAPGLRDVRELEVHAARVAAIRALRGWDAPDLIAACTRAQEISALEVSAEVAAILFGLSAVRMLHLELDEAAAFAGECLRLGEELGDPAVILQAHAAHAAIAFWRGAFEECRTATEKAERMFATAGSDEIARAGQDSRSLALTFAALSNSILGDAESAEMSQDALTDLIATSSHPFTDALSLQGLGWKAFHDRDARRAGEAAAGLRVVAERYDIASARSAARIFGGWSENGLHELLEGSRETGAFGARLERTLHAVMIAECCLRGRRIDEGLAAATEGIELARSGPRAYLSELLRVRGELRLESGDAAGAERDLAEAMETAIAQKAVAFELRAREVRSRLEQKGPLSRP